MRNALLIAWREIRWEIFGDRSAVLRMGIFAVLPIAFVLTNRSARTNDVALFGLALQSALFPALSGVALIASTFTQEKENGTIIPLLASPVRDLDIVVGKLVGMIVPVFAICVASVALYFGLVSAELVVLGVALVGSDVVALEIARRVWRREEVLARL